ncbi:MAG: hypothetical protein H0X37_06520 [Herpetosiphonaceae bacterium]|nr:hypothetical protein [Herpetosiphonaceae bacterium]
MNSNNQHRGAQQAARLWQALNETSSLACAEVAPLLDELIQAEAQDVDVERDPRFKPVLQHLNQCEQCTELYAEMSEDIAMVTSGPVVPVPAMLKPPVFFPAAATRQGQRWSLRVWQEVKRSFELLITPPQLAPKMAVLGSGEALVAERLDELPGTPLVAVTLTGTGEQPRLRVAVRDATPGTHWRIILTMGEHHAEAITDEQGVTDFVLPPSPLAELRLSCTETA